MVDGSGGCDCCGVSFGDRASRAPEPGADAGGRRCRLSALRSLLPHLALAVLVIVGFWIAALVRDGAAAPEDRPERAGLAGIRYDPPRPAPDFAALDHHGEPFRLARQPHPLALVFFGYVSCTDVCPTNLIKMGRIQEALGDDADQVAFVLVSVDPEHEPPAVMRERLAEYEGEIVGVTGDPAALEEVYDAWGVRRERVTVTRGDRAMEKIEHSGQIHLVRGMDELLASYPYGTAVEDMVADLRALIADPGFAERRLPAVGAVREVVLPPGAYTKRYQDDPDLPSYMRFRVGDTLRWVNEDYMYHFIGDLRLAPGESATQTFDRPGTFYFGCTAVPEERVRIVVHE